MQTSILLTIDMTNNNVNSPVNFEKLRSSPKNGKKRQRRSPPASPPRGCRVAAVPPFPFQFQSQAAIFPQQAAILTHQVFNQPLQSAGLTDIRCLYAGFTEPPSPAALPPPPVHWTRTVQSIAVAWTSPVSFYQFTFCLTTRSITFISYSHRILKLLAYYKTYLEQANVLSTALVNL